MFESPIPALVKPFGFAGAVAEIDKQFQRRYVWNREQVRGLMQSLYRKYPIGRLLIWVTQTNATKLGLKKLGLPISPTMRGPALPAPPESEEAIDAALEGAGLLPVQKVQRKA